MPTDRKPIRRRKRGYVDVGFETVVGGVEGQFNDARAAMKTKSATEAKAELYDLCRVVRLAKREFFDMLQSYGQDYKDNYKDFIDLVYAAADMAANSPFAEVQESLSRHARQIEDALAQCKEQGRENFSVLSLADEAIFPTGTV